MKSPNQTIRIAIQSSGRLRDGSLQYLESFGLQFEFTDRSLITKAKNFDLELLSVRDDDIPQYITQGVADYGIVGENVLYEEQPNANVIEKLNFCQCSLVIAVPTESSIQSIEDLQNERIATSYPNILAKFLKDNGIKSAIIPIKGSVEITPQLNLADAICDLTQTGTTLKQNGLRILATVCESEAVLITSPINRSQTSLKQRLQAETLTTN